MTQYLVFYGGASSSEAALYHDRIQQCHTTGGATNPVEYDRLQTVRHCLSMARELAVGPSAELVILAGFSGAALESDRRWLGVQLLEALEAKRAVISTDLHPLVCANLASGPGILAIAGTGASILAQDEQGALRKLGGRGHVFGDEGSAYAIAVKALRAAAQGEDGIGPKTPLSAALMAATSSEDLDSLARWSIQAPKRELAQLAKVVDKMATAGDLMAQGCIEMQARKLAAYVLSAQERYQLPEQSPVLMHGGLFRHCARFREGFETALNEYTWLKAEFPERDGVEAVCALAQVSEDAPGISLVNPLQKAALSPTESRTDAESPLEQCTPLEIVDRMIEADRVLPVALSGARKELAAVVEAAVETFMQGGRLFYIGAGTSGRLGVLDASECPPTFGVASDRVIGLIAGGEAALRESIEGAEDDKAAGARDLEAHTPSGVDMLIGIAASGTTPYVHGALEKARQLKLRTALLCCNPAVTEGADHIVTLATGPEVLTGSTRLKAGTATKMALNMITTGGLALSGYVYQGLMVGMLPKNVKLRHRAHRIVAELGGVDSASAEALLAKSDYDIAIAILMAKKGLGVEAARKSLHNAKGILYDALVDC